MKFENRENSNTPSLIEKNDAIIVYFKKYLMKKALKASVSDIPFFFAMRKKRRRSTDSVLLCLLLIAAQALAETPFCENASVESIDLTTGPEPAWQQFSSLDDVIKDEHYHLDMRPVAFTICTTDFGAITGFSMGLMTKYKPEEFLSTGCHGECEEGCDLSTKVIPELDDDKQMYLAGLEFDSRGGVIRQI